MATVSNIRAHVPGSAGATAGDAANGERNGSGPQQLGALHTVSGHPPGDDWQGITPQSFQVALHPGLRRPSPAGRLSRFNAWVAARLVLVWSCSMIAAGMRELARRRREGRNVAALERLDDVTLKDLGICRCEIEYAVRTQTSGRWRA